MTADLPRAERLIAEHTPSPVGDCMCGWSKHSRRGISHTAHVVQVLASAQLLACCTPDTAFRTIRLSPDRSDSMPTTRTITLTADQAREVLIGIATLDDTRRAFAVSVVVDALTAADEPVPAVAAEPAPAPMSSVRAGLHALAPLPWTADSDGEVWDGLSRYQFCVSGQDTGRNDARLAELVARIVNEPEPATAPSSRPARAGDDAAARLHDMLNDPAKWAFDSHFDVDAARDLRAVLAEHDRRQDAPDPVSDERTRAVGEVLATARSWVARGPGHGDVKLRRAVRALDALDGSGGAA